MSILVEVCKLKSKLSSRSWANDSATRTVVVRGRSTELETLQPGAFISDETEGQSKNQFGRLWRRFLD